MELNTTANPADVWNWVKSYLADDVVFSFWHIMCLRDRMVLREDEGIYEVVMKLNWYIAAP